ncbi:hypothetical protein [Sinorhizobium sp. BG8]|uniref:hypothetical protein n=1 Tax=Sinorhizobium sp. BG8 TaxID=2613773 RepID=UPI00193CA372|nr:hypothetical protein [Sinorhizobium sp. BG8]QRM54516.1 hypothetical protein F3Y30_08125 [Sinorhizobium sp. BG8]
MPVSTAFATNSRAEAQPAMTTIEMLYPVILALAAAWGASFVLRQRAVKRCPVPVRVQKRRSR